MSKYLNKGNIKFKKILKNEIYVDKTGLIKYTNDVLSTEQRFVCVSHPRRFGKTMAADMLEAYYCRTCDSHAQFDGLEISKSEKYETHINKYDVVFFTMTDVLSDEKDIRSGLAELEEDIVHDLKKAYPDIDYDGDDDLFAVLNDINSETKKKFVFIIDEWDCPFTEHEDDAEGHDDYFVFLRTLLKDKEYVALAYMTGIFPVSCFRTEVDLNMFDEFSMETPGLVKQYFGFTESEVSALCDERRFSYEDLDDFYNGYSFKDGQGKDLHIFNPMSVVYAILNDQLASYWPRTIGYKYLLRLLKNDVDGLHGLLLRLLNDERDITVFDMFHGNVITQENRRDVLTTLMHTGYLTFESGEGLRIPNLEIRRIFTDTIENIGTSPLSEYVNDSEKLLRAAEIDRDAEKACEFLEKIHEYYVSVVPNAEIRTIADFVKFAFVFARIDYRVETESAAESDFDILTFSPYQPSADPPILMGLGSGTDVEARARFAERFRENGYKGKILYIGINRNTSDVISRAHGGFTCKIETEEI